MVRLVLNQVKLLAVIDAAAARFDERPLHRASIAARQELATSHVRVSALPGDGVRVTEIDGYGWRSVTVVVDINPEELEALGWLRPEQPR